MDNALQTPAEGLGCQDLHGIEIHLPDHFRPAGPDLCTGCDVNQGVHALHGRPDGRLVSYIRVYRIKLQIFQAVIVPAGLEQDPHSVAPA
jgi:hypothetical protein